jgi:hypothetical protein
MADINYILQLLDWDSTEAEQQEGLLLARSVKCVSAFFQPAGVVDCGGKATWDNCALVIAERSDEELTPYIHNMFWWLRDMNWPGAEIILQRLLQFDRRRSTLIVTLRRFITRIVAADDKVWMYGFIWLLEEDPKLIEEVGLHLYNELVAAYRKK